MKVINTTCCILIQLQDKTVV